MSCPKIGLHKNKLMVGLKRYSELLKIKVVQEVRLGLITKEEASRRYGIKGHSTVLKWVRKFEAQNISINSIMPKSTESKEDLLKRIKELEQQLETEKLRSVGYSKIIDIAEEELKISIRKKSVTKQSK
jgi:transposase-like protein